MKARKFLTVRRGVAGICWTLLALTILAAPGLTWAADCNIQSSITKNPNDPYFLGQTTRVRYVFGAGNVTTQDQFMTIRNGTIRFALDCIDALDSTRRQNCLGFHEPDDPAAAEDDGDAIQYLGGLTWGSVTGSVCDGVTFTDNSPGPYPATDPNLLIFGTEDGSDLVFFGPESPAGWESCFIEFDVKVNSLGDTPDEPSVRGGVGWVAECTEGAGADVTQATTYNIDLEPELEILKEVSIDGGANWFDANDPPFPIGFVGYTLAQYRLTVENTGEETLVNVTINDAILGLDPTPLPTRCEPFAPGDICVITSGDTGFGILGDYGACQSPGNFTNLACADGTGALSGELAGQKCDPATVDCRQPAIDITKYVLDPATGVWEDADSAPGVYYPVGAVVSYRLEVCNVGDVALEDVYVEDFDLGISSTNIGALAVGQCVTLEEGDLTGLDSSLACANPGPFLNTAYADGFYGEEPPYLGPVEDDDPANVTCKDPSIDITKEVLDPVTGVWEDANSPPGVTYPVGETVYYRLIVCNDGDIDLEEVYVADATLGITSTMIGALAVGQCVTLTDGDLTGLSSSTVCATENQFTNIADADGFYLPLLPDGSFSGPVEDSDPANVNCEPYDASIAKTCEPDPVEVGQTINWDIEVCNQGDLPITCQVVDARAGIDQSVSLGAGAGTCQLIEASDVVDTDDGRAITNTATADCTVDGFSLTIPQKSSTATCRIPGEFFCRTPGFWKTHAGTEKAGRSSNLTQAVIDYADTNLTSGNGLGTICGVPITDTTTYDYTGTGVGDSNGYESAVEGMCVHPKTRIVRQMQRQLIAAAINCVVSGGEENCFGVPVHDDWMAANTDCTTVANGGSADLSTHIETIDDFNNGEYVTCSENIRDSIVFEGVDYKVPGPAGSSNACSEATSNDFYLVPLPPGEQ